MQIQGVNNYNTVQFIVIFVYYVYYFVYYHVSQIHLIPKILDYDIWDRLTLWASSKAGAKSKRDKEGLVENLWEIWDLSVPQADPLCSGVAGLPGHWAFFVHAVYWSQ